MAGRDMPDAAWWQQISSHLEYALTLSDEERAVWLASFRQENARLAERLEQLLDEQRWLAQERFLEGNALFSFPGDNLTGQLIGAYKLVSPLGRGGMGTVWRAERCDGRFKRNVAIKFLNIALAGPASEQRFKREGRILGRLSHPHIAELIDAGVSANTQPYLVLEYVNGEHIETYCDRRALDVEARVRLLLDVLAAVAHAHANLIVHRDIKPSNVLVRTDGQVKLLDFGIAKLLENDASTGAVTLLTREGESALTPEYAAPEQLTGAPVSTATDVYCLGVLLYLLLTGHHPAGSATRSPADLVKAIVHAEPPRLSDVVVSAKTDAAVRREIAAKRSTTPERLERALRGDLDTIAAKALKKNSQERYVSVTAFADDLRRYLKHEPITARPDTLAYRTAKFVRRNRTPVALAGLAFVAAVAGLLGTMTEARTARLERDFALRQLSRAEAINYLNTFVLSDAPAGKPFTVSELLGRAEKIIERQHAQDGASRVELLITIGTQYASQQDTANARRVLDEAYKLSRRQHEPVARAKASCAFAGVLTHSGELVRAEAFIQEGLRELPTAPQFALDRVYCLLRGTEVSLEHGAAGEAVARAQAAQSLLKQAPFHSEPLEMHALISLASAYRVAGQPREASAAFEEASKRLDVLGRGETETAGTLFNNWGIALYKSGQSLEAEKALRRAIDISRADRSEDAASPMLLINYARALRDIGRVNEAARNAEHGYAKALRKGDDIVVNQSLLLRASIYRAQGDLKRAADMLSEVQPRLQASLPAGHIGFASFRLEQAQLAAARRDFPQALDFANQALTIAEAWVKSGREKAEYVPNILMRRSDIELELHQFYQAASDAERAANMLQQNAQHGAFSSTLGRAWMALARARQAQGKADEARAALRSATENLENTLGTDHFETQAARQLAKDLDPSERASNTTQP